jgi:TolB-like protein
MNAPAIRPRAWLQVLALCLLAVLVTGGAPSVRRSVGGRIPSGVPRAALMPFENLAGREEESQTFTKVFFAELVASGSLEMVDPTSVDAAMESLGVRGSGGMTLGEVRAMSDTLHAPYLLLGSVLESSTLQTPEGPMPSVGAALRLVEAASGRVLWAGVHFRSGQDKESVFGWGRVSSAERLVSELAYDMLKDFRDAGAKAPKPSQASGTEKPK